MAHWKVVLNIITCNLASLYVMPHVKTTIFPFSQDESVRGALKARREQHCFRKMSIIRVLLKACRAAKLGTPSLFSRARDEILVLHSTFQIHTSFIQ